MNNVTPAPSWAEVLMLIVGMVLVIKLFQSTWTAFAQGRWASGGFRLLLLGGVVWVAGNRFAQPVAVAMTDMATSELSMSIALLFIIVLVLALGLLGLGGLVWHPATRKFGLGMLGVLGLLVLLGLPLLFWVSMVSVRQTDSSVTVSNWPSEVRKGSPRTPAVPIALLAEAPLTTPPTKSANLPAWVKQPAETSGRVYRTTAVSDPYATRQECDVAINDQLLALTREYLHRMGEIVPAELPVDVAYLRHNVCQEEFWEVLDTSVGPMQRLYLRLEFSEPVYRELHDKLREAVVRQRVVQAGGGATLVLAILGTLFGYLQLDTATKGYYTRRLQLGAGGVILALLATVALLV